MASVGTVVSWTWQPEPLEGQPLDRPFAWALITLDGADTPLLHAVDAESSDAISTGARVHAHWVDETVGAITDIAYFAIGDEAEDIPAPAEGLGSGDHPGVAQQHRDPAHGIASRKRLPAGTGERQVAGRPHNWPGRRKREGVFPGARKRGSGNRQAARRIRRTARRGHGDEFAIINIPFAGQRIKPPYVAAYVLLDGADIAFLHLVSDIDADKVRMGMRVQAVWRPREEWGLGIDNIEYFRPTGDPDADYDTYKHHL